MPVPWDIADDFETVVDGDTAVTVWNDTLSTSYAIGQALRRAVDVEEREISQGAYRSIDTVWNFSSGGALANVTIVPGWFVMQGVSIWRILRASNRTLSNRWRAECRTLQIETTETVTIEVALHTQSSSGASQITWSPFATNVVGRLQRIDNAPGVEKQSRRDRERAKLYTLTQFLLDTNYRVFDGTYYWNVTGYEKPDDIAVLPALNLERTPWPLS